MKFQASTLLAERFNEAHRQLRKLWLQLWGGGCLVIFAGSMIAWFLAQPAPPRTVVMAAGPADGSYYEFATRYAAILKRQGIDLVVKETAGSIENYRLLEADNDIHLAILQGGAIRAAQGAPRNIESLASLYLEPVWVFYHSDQSLPDLRAMRQKRLAVGLPESGTQAIARILLKENGVEPSEENQFLQIGGQEAKSQLINGSIDVAFFVLSPQSPIVHDLLHREDIRLLCFDRHAAYAHRHPYLCDLTLAHGVIDMVNDLPKDDVTLVAPAANLVASPALHDALIPLLLRTVEVVHEQGDILVRKGRFPSAEFVEAPLNDSARRYFESGPPFLQKYLPFWIASAIDRGKILLLPALTLLLPLFKIAPPIYRWRIRSRIYKWYEVLRQVEGDLVKMVPVEILQDHAISLGEIEKELDELDSVPLPYMEEFYNLRLHLEFVERRVLRAQEDTAKDDET